MGKGFVGKFPTWDKYSLGICGFFPVRKIFYSFSRMLFFHLLALITSVDSLGEAFLRINRNSNQVQRFSIVGSFPTNPNYAWFVSQSPNSECSGYTEIFSTILNTCYASDETTSVLYDCGTDILFFCGCKYLLFFTFLSFFF
jgi:hypothetical protein